MAKRKYTSKKQKKNEQRRKYFLFFIAGFIAIGIVGWQFKADATPATQFKVTPVAMKKAHTNYVELKQR
jgi:hypothetical protein